MRLNRIERACYWLGAGSQWPRGGLKHRLARKARRDFARRGRPGGCNASNDAVSYTHLADLAQDTYLRLMHSGRLPARDEQSRAFLVQVAKGLVIDLHRRRALEQSYLDAIAALPPDSVPSPETRALILEALTEVDAMLDRLPAKAREAFLLSQLDGLGYKEIAARLARCV